MTTATSGRSSSSPFRLAGFDVLAASNGLEALLYVKRERPDAVVLDLMMPRLGGVEALERIHSFNPGIRVLVVTGNIDPELQRQATRGRRGGRVHRPVPAATLVAALAGPAAGSRRRRPAPVAAPPVAEAGAPTGRVLVVDDNPEVRKMLEDVLTSLGYRTRTAADARRGGTRGPRRVARRRAARRLHARAQRSRGAPHDRGAGSRTPRSS